MAVGWEPLSLFPAGRVPGVPRVIPTPHIPELLPIQRGGAGTGDGGLTSFPVRGDLPSPAGLGPLSPLPGGKEMRTNCLDCQSRTQKQPALGSHRGSRMGWRCPFMWH